mmetsp:Transcript_29248/g.90488  ORF Transcript_29248/g.90488 Transcript_29248/m.90488 type:complete len:107 (-) Transcript_29248:643-963(-)
MSRHVSLSAFALLFSELVQYQTVKIRSANDRDHLTRRENNVTAVLQVRAAWIYHLHLFNYSSSLQLAGSPCTASPQIPWRGALKGMTSVRTRFQSLSLSMAHRHDS